MSIVMRIRSMGMLNVSEKENGVNSKEANIMKGTPWTNFAGGICGKVANTQSFRN